MKKISELASWAIVAVLAIGICDKIALARLTGTDPKGYAADTWCEGKPGDEVCVDYNGDLLQTTASTGTLGTSALPWATVYTDAETINGLVTASSATVTNSLTANGQLGLMSRTSAQIGVLIPYTTGAILWNSTFATVCASTGVAAGAWVYISSSSSANQRNCYQ